MILITGKLYTSKKSHKLLKRMMKKYKLQYTRDINDTSIVGVIMDSKYLDIIKYPNLRVISRCGIGVNNIDMNVVNRNRILFYNVTNVHSSAVAFHTLRLMVDLIGIVTPDMVIGIIGFGRVGKSLTDYLHYHKNYIIHDIQFNTELEDILKESDIVTLHIPYTKQSYHIINKETISQMKDGAYIINTSRGELIDEDAIHDALVSGKLSGFASDVNNKDKFEGLHNVIITNHIASDDIKQDMERESINNIIKGIYIGRDI